MAFKPRLSWFAERWLSLVIFAFFATIPLAHTPSLRQGLAAVVLVYAIFLLYEKRVPRPLVVYPMMAWATLYLLSVLWSIDPSYTIQSFKNEVVYPFASFAAFYVVLSLRDEKNAVVLGVVASVVILLAVILAAVLPLAMPGENFLNFVRSFHFMASNDTLKSNSYYFPGVSEASNHLALATPIIFAGILYSSRPWFKVGMILAGAAICFAGLLTANRTFWIAVIAVAVLFWSWRLQAARSLTVMVGGLLTIGILLSVGDYTMHHRSSSSQDLKTIFESNIRWELWKYWSRKGLERPWLGAGGGYWIPKRAYGAEAVFLPHDARAHGHNILLNTWLRLGIPGVIVFLWLIGALVAEFRTALRNPRVFGQMIGVCGIGTVLAMLVKNSTDDFMQFAFAMHFWALVGALLGSMAHHTHTRRATGSGGHGLGGHSRERSTSA